MPRFSLPRSLRSTLLAGATGWLLLAGAVAGCAGSLDPSLTGTGGTNGTGSGGSMGSGGGGSSADCSGANDGAMIVTNTCAGNTGCHVPNSALGAGLDLTVDSGIKSRLVGVMSAGTGLSACRGNSEAYLTAGSNPAQGLLIDKVTMSSPPCGAQMPYLLQALSATQQQCLIKWAGTLTQ